MATILPIETFIGESPDDQEKDEDLQVGVVRQVPSHISGRGGQYRWRDFWVGHRTDDPGNS